MTSIIDMQWYCGIRMIKFQCHEIETWYSKILLMNIFESLFSIWTSELIIVETIYIDRETAFVRTLKDIRKTIFYIDDDKYLSYVRRYRKDMMTSSAIRYPMEKKKILFWFSILVLELVKKFVLQKGWFVFTKSSSLLTCQWIHFKCQRRKYDLYYFFIDRRLLSLYSTRIFDEILYWYVLVL